MLAPNCYKAQDRSTFAAMENSDPCRINLEKHAKALIKPAKPAVAANASSERVKDRNDIKDFFPPYCTQARGNP